jgi:hypothetical protein
VKRSTLLAGVAVVLLLTLAPASHATAAASGPSTAQPPTARAAGDTSRRAAFARACPGPAATAACDRYLAPLACSPANPFTKAPFSCQYLLGLHPCHADPRSNLCELFLSNYCFERPDSVACFFFRADSAQCRMVADAGIAPPSPTCALFGPETHCNVVEADGSPPASPECQLYAAAFLDYCQQRAEAGACNNPYGGAEEGLDFVTRTRACPTKRRPHRRCRVRKAAALARAAPASATTVDPKSAGPWPFSTITYYVGQTRADGTTGPAPAQWAAGIVAAFRAWSSAHAGWTFVRASSPRRGDADVLALAAPGREAANCVGVSARGFGYTQVRLALGGTCLKRGVLALATAHEIGHLLGLGHETQACSVMNTHFILVGGRPRPSGCGAGTGYVDGLVQAADVRAARSLTALSVGAAAPCDPAGGELPVFAQDLACKYTVNCATAKGRNVFDEPGTVVIDAEIAARCHRVLRVRALGETGSDPPKGAAASARRAFAGSSSQGKPISFVLRDGAVRGLSVGLHFDCTDNTSVFGNSILAPKPSAAEAGLLASLGLTVVDRRVSGNETVGPFPPLPTTRNGLQASLEAPNDSALYDVQATLEGGSWHGTVRVTEGWHSSPIGLIPDPDGEFVCDTGQVSFTASPSR